MCHVLPKYQPGLSAAKVNLLTCLALVSSGPSVVAGVLKKMFPILVCYGFGLGIIWGVGRYICLNGTPDIVDIAWLRFFVSAGVSIFVIGYNYWLTRRTISV